MKRNDRIELIRLGNKLFNEGKLNEATKIFVKTNYQDGLTRIGDYLYYDQKKPLEAIRFYQLANCQDKVAEIYDRMFFALGKLLSQDKQGEKDQLKEESLTKDEQFQEGSVVNVELPPLKVSPKLKLYAEEILRENEKKSS